MISINNVSKNYGQKILFENISFSINKGEKIGLIGPNGAGKSTFFSLILGETEPSGGSIQKIKNIRIGYLPQEASFKSDQTVLSEITEGDREILNLVKEKEELEQKNKADSNRYGEILHELEVLDYFELEHKAKKILSGLGFKEKDFIRPINQMSGGWQMRTLLAKLLTLHYDFLLLDEPTNYLDLNAAIWLKDFLKNYKGSFLMISHDKVFLTEVTNYTLILENGMITKVHGNYEHYEQIKEEKRIHLLKQFKEQEKKKEQLEKFISRFHAQPNKASSVRAKRKFLEQMDEVILPPDPRESIRDFKFPQTRASGHRVIKLDKISKAYGDIQVYRDFDFEIFKDEKAVLVGENGAGKSTLLKILGGIINIDSGSRVVGHNVDIGYFSQTRMDVLNPENTVLREVYSAAPGFTSEETIRTILGAFLFTGDDSDKKVSVLSGGEKSRLILAKLLINPPNFLLLDEPTTHLDIDAVEALIKALKDYQGTICFISHDIYFVESLANVVYDVSAKGGSAAGGKDTQVKKYPGRFDYYLEKKTEDKDENLTKSKNHSRELPQPLPTQSQIIAGKKKEEEKHRKEQEKKLKIHNDPIKQKIDKLRKERDDLNLESYAKARALSDTRGYRDEETLKGYGRRLKEIQNRLVEIEKEIELLRCQLW
ncbi:MAG: ABC-F family ATP-binding cassette domain-containing protein [Candidatus Omnitrophota bacterium]